MTTMTSEQLLEAALDGKLDMDSGAIGEGDTTGDEGQNKLTQQQPANTATVADDEPVGAPIASKSGGYTIAYEKLSEARTQRDQFKAEAEALRAQLESLSAAQQANLAQAQQDATNRAQAGNAPTEADQNLQLAQGAIGQGVDVSIFGDFSEEALAAGIEAAQPGNRLGDVSCAVGDVAREYGYPINLEFGGHGVGHIMHGDPHVPNDGKAHHGYKLRPGLVIAIEPWFLKTTDEIYQDPKDGWTLKSEDGSRGAHSEHTIAITENGPVILTVRD